MKKQLERPEPQHPGYPFGRIVNDAAVIEACKKMGGVELHPPKRSTTGFEAPRGDGTS